MIAVLYRSKLARYALIGGISTLIHTAVAFGALHWIGSSVLGANIGGFVVAYLFSYTVQSHYVFVHELGLAKAFKYFLVQLGALLGVIALSNLLREAGAYLQTLVIVCLMPLATFVVHKSWTFAGSPRPESVQ